eukprot:TRINITY_DN8383_c1_g2_i1.p1 TRINITY_DN8383_c1_g2~~TRINITY_DN8383_c1_g2_i1.p1  ORF type:complete len:264 (+),score=65.24 TRINITY_DN8383_c1_g2_i1:113-904(+)
MSGQRVLDVGCGTGALSLRAAFAGASVVSVDWSEGMMEMATARVREAEQQHKAKLDVDFVERDVHALADAGLGEFDVIMAHDVIPYLRDPPAALQTLRRMLKPSGICVMSSFADIDANPGIAAVYAAIRVSTNALDVCIRSEDYGLSQAPNPCHRYHSNAVAEAEMRAAGFGGVDVSRAVATSRYDDSALWTLASESYDFGANYRAQTGVAGGTLVRGDAATLPAVKTFHYRLQHLTSTHHRIKEKRKAAFCTFTLGVGACRA